MSDTSDMYRTGCSAGLVFWYDGGRGIVGGNSPPAFAMAEPTSCAAASILRSSANWMLIIVRPCELVEFIDSMPAMVASWRSIGVATDEAMVSGLAPGRAAMTWRVG